MDENKSRVQAAWRKAVEATEIDDARALLEIMRETPEIATLKSTSPGDWADEKRSIFHEAALRDSVACVDLLVREGLDMHEIWGRKSGRDKYEHTPLTLVITCESQNKKNLMMAALMSKPPSKGLTASRGWELAMMAAVRQSEASTIGSLYAHLGSEWSQEWSKAIDGQKCNLLHLAADDGCMEVLDLLLEWPGMEECAGQYNAHNKTPSELALRRGHEEFASKLTAWLAATKDAVEIAAVIEEPRAAAGQKSRL